MNIEKKKQIVALASVISNTSLVLLKIIAGFMVGSVSILSEAIHSGVDLLAAVIAFFAVRSSAKPADEDHHFGHGKFENLSGFIEALLIFVAAGWIIWEAVHKLLAPAPIEAAFWGVAVMAISTVCNLVVSHFLFKVGKESDSVALLADAWHLRTDIYTSIGVMGALAIIGIGRWFWPDADLTWVDPLGAILVALLILKAAYDLTAQSLRDLADMSLPAEEQKLIREAVATLLPRYYGIHHFRTRKSGPQRFIDFHMLVDRRMSVEASHHLSHETTEVIRRQFPGSSVQIHIEPCDGRCRSRCREGCVLSDSERKQQAARTAPSAKPD